MVQFGQKILSELKLEKCPFVRAKNWTCKITKDLMESDCGNKKYVGTLLGGW